MSTSENENLLQDIADSLRDEMPSLSKEEIDKLAKQILMEKSQ